MSIQYFDTSELDGNPIFSKTIHIRQRENSDYYYLDGFITYRGDRKRIHRVTNKLVNKSNKLWLERNLHQSLWELSDFYKEIEKNKITQKIDTTPTVGEFGLISIQMNKPNRKLSSHNKVVSIFNRDVLSKFGDRKLNSFTEKSELSLWQNELIDGGKSPKTVKNIRSVLQTIFEDAVNDNKITNNPFERVKQPKVVKSEIDPFTLDEVTLILKNISDKYKPMFVLSFFSGMRWGEILGLVWKNVDFINNTIIINQSIVMGIISTPKTDSSYRVIDMLPIVREYLLIQKERNLNTEWVFVNQYKNHYERTDSLNNRVLKPLLEKIKLQRRPLRQSRHTFASMMLSQNEDILWVSNMLGHKDKTITLNTYSKYVKQTKVERGKFSNSLPIS